MAAFRWLPAIGWGEIGGLGAGATGFAGGVIAWKLAGNKSSNDQLGTMLDLSVWGMVGFACAWPFGVAAGTSVYGKWAGGHGSFLGALAGSLVATGTMVGLGYLAGGHGGAGLAVAGVLVVPPVASALGYSWTSSAARPRPEVSLSLLQYDGRSGIRLATPAVTVSAASGVRRVSVPLLSGTW